MTYTSETQCALRAPARGKCSVHSPRTDCRGQNRFLALAFFWLLLNCPMAMAFNETPEELAAMPPLIDEARGLVVARQFIVGSNEKGGVLRLPDGSVIRTVWPAALTLDPAYNAEPVWPRCEPAVYSLARVMPDGKELWAKSYVYYWKSNLKYNDCPHPSWGFSIRSALGDVSEPGFYRVKYDRLFFIGELPGSGRSLAVDADTGEVRERSLPGNLAVIDAHVLKALKEHIHKDIEKNMPPYAEKNMQTHERIYRTQLFRRLQEKLFPKAPTGNY